MRAAEGGGRRLIDLAVSIAALALGAPGCAGLAMGMPLADWPIPFHPQLGGEIALKTVVYLSGLLAAYGAIGLVWRVWGDEGASGGFTAPPLSRMRADGPAPGGASSHTGAAEPEGEEREGPVSIAEPLYGFLPGAAQRRLARETGYQALLFTKISILMSAAIGVLLAGSWEAVSLSESIPSDAALRIGAGLYLMAESLRRYQCFARGGPSGTLVGTLVQGALGPLLRRDGAA